MYEIQVDHIVYRRKDGTREGRPFTLIEAMRELYGCANARVLRLDGTVAVLRAGSSYEVIHAPTGRKILRRIARHLRNRRAGA